MVPDRSNLLQDQLHPFILSGLVVSPDLELSLLEDNFERVQVVGEAVRQVVDGALAQFERPGKLIALASQLAAVNQGVREEVEAVLLVLVFVSDSEQVALEEKNSVRLEDGRVANELRLDLEEFQFCGGGGGGVRSMFGGGGGLNDVSHLSPACELPCRPL